VAEIGEALAAFRATGARAQSTYHLILLAQALAACGRFGEGLSTLGEAASLVEETGERYVAAEIYRLEGNLLLAENGSAEAEASYRGRWRFRGRKRHARSNCAPPTISPACGRCAARARGRRIC
jgi:predicted ATPase